MAREIYHLMAGGPVGDLVDMGGPSKTLTISVTAATLVRAAPYDANDPAFVPPTAPSATPAPASGGEAAAGWVKMAANSTKVFAGNYDGKSYRYVEVWELNAGDMQLTGDQ